MAEREFTERRRRAIAIISFTLAVALLISVAVFAGIPMVRFLKQPERFRAWVEQRGFWGKVAFVCMEVVKVVVAVIPGEPFELAAGYAFGTWMGMLLCSIGIFTGSMMVFLTVRRFGMPVARIFFSQERLDSLKFLRYSKRRNLIIFAIVVIPGTPKDLLGYFVGLTDINVGLWVFLCSVGRIPSIVSSTISGDAFMEKRYLFGIAVLVCSFAVGMAGLWVYNRILNRSRGEEGS